MMADTIISSTVSSPLLAATPPPKRIALTTKQKITTIRSAPTTNSTETKRTIADSADVLYSGERFHHYDIALRVYSALRNGRCATDVSFPDASTKLSIYRLAFDVIYHREVIEDLLIESCFYSRNCHLHGHEDLVILMAFDYQNSKFSLKLPHSNGSENIPIQVLRVAEALCKHRVRLNAALARMRVKSNAQTTSQLMSENLQLKYKAVLSEPFYARVCSKRVGNFQREIASRLSNDGFTLCGNDKELGEEKKRLLFCCRHTHLLAFSPDAKSILLQHELITEGCLVQQDSGSYYLIESLRGMLTQCSGDVLITHCNAGVEVAHVASILNGDARVITYGVTPVQVEALSRKLQSQHIDNVDFVYSSFRNADIDSEKLLNVSIIICLPPSSLSTVTQPLDYILQEGDYVAPLLLSQKNGLNHSFPREQRDALAKALTVTQCQQVIYAVRSQDPHEISHVISTCLEQHRAAITGKADGSREYLQVPFESHDSGMTGAGYHVTVLERKPEDPAPTASEVIAKAITSGVLSSDGLDSIVDFSPTQTGTHTKKKKKKKKTIKVFSQHKGIPMTISAQNKVISKKHSTNDVNSRRPFR